MIKVLFVCLGNICRSPMAEAVFSNLVRQKGLEDQFVIDSAGVSDYHIGEPPHQGTIEKLKDNGINAHGLTARQISPSDFEHFNYIIAMDDDNLDALKQMMNDDTDVKLVKLLDFLSESEISNVPDPYFTGDFDETYQLVNQACQNLFDEIRLNEDID